MPAAIRDGSFYRFDRLKKGKEIGPSITRNNALAWLKKKKNIYTPRSPTPNPWRRMLRKAKRSGKALIKAAITRTFHPAGDHEKYGHVFYGPSGLRQGEARR